MLFHYHGQKYSSQRHIKVLRDDLLVPLGVASVIPP